MKKFISVLCALLLLLSLSACKDDFDNYLSGNSLPPPSSGYEGELEKYHNPVLGIIIEYPAEYQRIGNIDVDGHISFEGNGNEIFVYTPDLDSKNLGLTSEEYALQVLGLPEAPGAGMITYGKTTGYRTFATIDGRTVVQFIIKGLECFYRVDFASSDASFSESDPVFVTVMDSLRVEDGVYSMLNKMLAEYRLLLEYATTMQYVTDANYANHCLNTYETSGDETYLNNAITTFNTIKSELSQISAYTPHENESFSDQWNKIAAYTNEAIAACDDALAAIEAGNIKEAQRLCRVAFTYDLSETADNFIFAISTEIGEY